ncbi:hypothetical protein VC116059_001136B, partial [Vibrio cholerae O1 str. 116059]
LFNFEKT